MTTRSYAIIGTGALGGYYGGCLARAGCDVHFLLRSDYEHVREHGLMVESCFGDFHLPQVQAYNDVSDMPACDVVIVALKTTENGLLPALLEPLARESNVALVLQNGLGMEAIAADIFGAERVLGGLCFLCSNKVGPGHIRHLNYGRIALGEYRQNGEPAGITPWMTDIGNDFEQAGIEIIYAEDLLLARWQKLVWNIPFNGLTVVLRQMTDRIMANAASRELAEQLMSEVVDAARWADNRQIDPEHIQRMLEDTEQMSPYKTSMMLDFECGRPMEVESIFGNPYRAALNAGYDPQRLGMIYRQLKFLEANREA